LASHETVIVVNCVILGDVRRFFLIILAHTRGPTIFQSDKRPRQPGGLNACEHSMNLTSESVDDLYLKALIVTEAVVTKMPCKLCRAR
jgi:hypothetical protein